MILYAIEEANRLNHHYIGTEHLLLGLVRNGEGVATGVLDIMGVSLEQVRNQVMRVLRHITAEQRGSASGQSAAQRQSKTPYLDALGIDLTDMAEAGRFPTVIERRQETQLLCRVLGQRSRSNAILIGETGVGKTSIIQFLAKRIVSGDVPDTVKGKRLVQLDITALFSGAAKKEQVEERMRRLLQEVWEIRCIVVVDNLHMLFGDSDEKMLSVGRILEQSITEGKTQCIGETYPLEYRNYISQRPFAKRSLYPIQVLQPTKEETLLIINSLRVSYEDFHKLSISDDAVNTAMSFVERNRPESSPLEEVLSLIDEAASRVRMERSAIPPQLRDALRGLEALRKEREAAIEDQQYDLASDMREHEERMQARIAKFEREMGTTEEAYVTGKDILDVARERAVFSSPSPGIFQLLPHQARQLQQAILLAFPTDGVLEQLAFFGLGQNLNVISSGSNLAQRAWELIRWTESTHQTHLLIQAAREQNPGNEVLRRICEEIMPSKQEAVTDNEQQAKREAPDSAPS